MQFDEVVFIIIQLIQNLYTENTNGNKSIRTT